MPVDFSGTWKCIDLEGDWDKFLEAQGIGWIKRKAAKAFDYGKGKQKQIITMEGDKVTVVNHGQKETTVTFIIGGGQQSVTTPEGGEETVNPIWDGDILDMGASGDSGMRRYMDGERMVVEIKTGSLIVRRFFRKD